MEEPFVDHRLDFCWIHLSENHTMIPDGERSARGRSDYPIWIGVADEAASFLTMRSSSEVVIEVNIVKALMHKIPFHLSSNKVILSEGNKDGCLPA